MLNQLLGGILIGLGSVCLLLFTGYLSGMNSMWDTIFVNRDDFQYRWKTVWLSVFILIGLLFSRRNKVETLPISFSAFISFLILGFGVRMAQGCTSGHGINGLSRLSKRSLVAVSIFFSFAVIVASFFKTLKIKKNGSITSNVRMAIILLIIIWNIYSYKKTEKRDEDKKVNYYNLMAIVFSASLFAVGLVISGMFKYSIVKNTINFRSKKWNPKLFVVFGSAVSIALIGYQLIFKYMKSPINKTCEQTYLKQSECKFILPRRNKIDLKLLLGSSIFGIGWGLTGMCPSTFPIRLGIGDKSAYLGLIGLFLGYQLENQVENIVKLRNNKDSNIILHQFYDPPSFSFTYIVGDKRTNEVVIIDSVYNKTNYEIPTNHLIGNLYYVNKNMETPLALLKFCDMMNYKIKYLMNTHIHVDHITANSEIKKLRYIPSIIGDYENTSSDYKYELKDNKKEVYKEVKISNNIGLLPINTPGHTENCFSLLLFNKKESIVFSGDLLLIKGIGRTDLDKKHSKEQIRENKNIMFNSLELLLDNIDLMKNLYTDNIMIYPAHDYQELRSVSYKELLKVNPYIQLVNKYIETGDEHIKKEFIDKFEENELKLATFDDFDINMCVDINKMCGVIDNVKPKDLDRLWMKKSGACG
jgi:uncharacterized membrane protein YedE/YeeE/glyoxylase-like metal-dependent hydrolase (beta-lactamase superfamily II)